MLELKTKKQVIELANELYAEFVLINPSEIPSSLVVACSRSVSGHYNAVVWVYRTIHLDGKIFRSYRYTNN